MVHVCIICCIVDYIMEGGKKLKKRTCPECQKSWYSADEEAEYWRCEKCGTKMFWDIQEDA